MDLDFEDFIERRVRTIVKEFFKRTLIKKGFIFSILCLIYFDHSRVAIFNIDFSFV
jgi:hypothetical protein